MAAHQASATQMSSPTGCCANRSRIVLTIGVTGWFSANQATGAGIVSVGTNAELMNGRKMSGYENALAPSTVLADRPAITAIQVRDSVNRIRMPNTASHPRTLVPVRKPRISATPTTITMDAMLATSDVSTCAQSELARAIGIDWKRSKIPPCRSRNSRYAVYAMPDAIVMSRMPGSMKLMYDTLDPVLIAPPNT